MKWFAVIIAMFGVDLLNSALLRWILGGVFPNMSFKDWFFVMIACGVVVVTGIISKFVVELIFD